MNKSCINLVKLSVGSETIESLAAWQTTRQAQAADGRPRHITRMWPKRAAELLAGGSIYWVVKGMIQCRQRIHRLDEYFGEDGIRRCAIVLEPDLVATQTAVKSPFQGWRYLSPEDAPHDVPKGRAQETALPPDLNRALAEIGVL